MALICAAGAAILTWPQLLRLERTFPIAQIISFRGLLAAVFAALMIIALLLALARPVRALALALAGISFVAAAANAGVLVYRGVGSDTLPA